MRNWFWLLISAAAAAHAAPPERVDIWYDIRHNGGSPVAHVAHQLHHDGRAYELRETWTGKGFYALRGTVRRTSRGTVSAGGLQPLEFTDERTGRRTARATFDWQAKTVTMQYKGGPRVEPLPPDGNDRLAFLFDFAFAPRLAGEVSFHLMDGRGRSRHVYSVGGRERLSTPAGNFEALRLVRDSGGDRTEIWFAADRSYLPVRILVTDRDGTHYDQIVTKISAP